MPSLLEKYSIPNNQASNTSVPIITPVTNNVTQPKSLLEKYTAPEVTTTPFTEKYEEYSDIGKDYKFVPVDTSYDTPLWENPSPTTKFKNIKGGGQYVYDPQRPETLIKSERFYTPELLKMERQGLSNRLWQIDHIVPLALGGADTSKNKEKLSITQHNIKTAANAVAMELYYNKKIPLSKARDLALDWKGKNVDGIVIDENTGRIPLSVAEQKFEEWKNPTIIKPTQALTKWDEIKKSIPGQVASGVVSGLTMGWVPTEEYKYDTAKEQTEAKVAKMGGQLVGGLISFIPFIKGAQMAAGALKLGSLFKNAGVFIKGAETAGEVIIPRLTGIKVLENIGAFTTHGQLSKQEDNSFQERTKRFLYDATYGTLFGMAGQNLKSYAGLGMGVYTLSSMEGSTPSEALLNTTLMVGLHGVGAIGLKSKINAAATKGAIDYRAKYLEGVTMPDEIKSLPYNDPNRLDWENNQMFESIKQRSRLIRDVSLEELKSEYEKALTTARQIYKGGLGREQSLKEEIIDTQTLYRRAKQMSQAELSGLPPQTNGIFSNINKIFSRPTTKISQEELQMQNNKPTGSMYSTGVAETISPKTTKDIREYINSGAQEGDTLIILKRNDMDDFMKIKNAGLPYTERINPENNLQIFGEKNGKLYSLGFFPSEDRINIKPNNINTSIKPYDLPPVDPKFNKDNFGTSMDSNGSSIITAKLVKISPEAKNSGQPWLTFEVSKEDWARSPELNRVYREGLANESIKISNESIKPNLQNRRGVPQTPSSLISTKGASDIIENKYEDSFGKTSFTNILKNHFEDIFRKGDPETLRLYMKKLGIYYDKESAKNIIDHAKDYTVGDVIELLKANKNNEKLSGFGNTFYDLMIGNRDSLYASLTPQERSNLYDLKLLQSEDVVKSTPSLTKTSLEVPKTTEKTPEKTLVEAISKVTDKYPVEKQTTMVEIKPQETSIVPENVSPITRTIKEAPKTLIEYTPNIKIPNKSLTEFSSTGIHKGSEILLDSYEKQRIAQGDINGAKKINEFKNKLKKPNLMRSAKNILTKNNNDPQKSFDEFESNFSKEFKKLGIESPFNNTNRQALKSFYFKLLAQPKSRITINGNVADIKTEGNRNLGYIGNKLAAINKKIVYFDNTNSKLTGFTSAEKDKEIFNTMMKNGVLPIGQAGTKRNTTMGVNLGKKWISDAAEKFDKTPEKYLSDKEILISKDPETLKFDKALKVLRTDVLKIQKNAGADELVERLKQLESDSFAPLKGEKVNIIVLGLNDSDKLKNTNFKTSNLTGDKNAINDFEEGTIKDGSIWGTPDMVKKLTKARGFDFEAEGLKPMIVHPFSKIGDNGELNNFVSTIKGYTGTLENSQIKMIEKIIGKKIPENTLVMTTNNVKFGSKDLLSHYPSIKGEGRDYHQFTIPSEEVALQFFNKPTEGASFSTAHINKLSYNDNLNEVWANFNLPTAEKFIEFNKKLKNSTGPEILNVLKEYNIPETSLPEDLVLKLQHGAGWSAVGKQLDNQINSIFQKRILSGQETVDGSVFKGLEDWGFKNGSYLQEEVMMSKEKWRAMGKPSYVLVLRNPVQNATEMIKLKVLVGEDYDVNHLGKNHLVLPSWAVKIMGGDWDGDPYVAYSIGGKKGIPDSIINKIISKQGSEGMTVLNSLSTTPKKSLTVKGLQDMLSISREGAEAVGQARSTARSIDSLVGANVQIKTYTNKSGNKVIETWVGDKIYGKPVITKTKVGPGYKSSTIVPNWGKEERYLSNTLEQEAVQAPKKINLHDRLKGETARDYLIKNVWKTEDKDVIKAIKKIDGEFQLMYNLANKDITLKSTKETAEKLKRINDLSDIIEKNGGKIGVVGSNYKLYKDFEAQKVPDNKELFKIDQQIKNEFSKEYSNRFNIRETEESINRGKMAEKKNKEGKIVQYYIPTFKFEIKNLKDIDENKIKIFVNRLKQANSDYTTFKGVNEKFINKNERNKIFNRLKTGGYSVSDINNLKEVRREIKNETKDWFDKYTIDFNPSEKEVSAYWLINSPEGDVNQNMRFYKENIKDNKNTAGVYRWEEEIIKLNPEMAKEYYNIQNKLSSPQPVAGSVEVKPEKFKDLSAMINK